MPAMLCVLLCLKLTCVSFLNMSHKVFPFCCASNSGLPEATKKKINLFVEYLDLSTHMDYFNALMLILNASFYANVIKQLCHVWGPVFATRLMWLASQFHTHKKNLLYLLSKKDK